MEEVVHANTNHEKGRAALFFRQKALPETKKEIPHSKRVSS